MASVECHPRSRPSRKILLAAPVLAAVGYLYLSGWFWWHQREFLYAPGGTITTPAAVGLPDFSIVEIS